MSLSRMETKKREQQTKDRSKKKKRRLWLVNTSLLAIIIIVVAIFFGGENLWITAKEQVSKLSMFKDTTKESTVEVSGVTNEKIEPTDPLITEDSKDNSAIDENTVTEDPVTIEEEEITPIDTESTTVNLAFVGDILQGEYINSWLQKEGYSYPFQKALLHLSVADITAGNLEMPITTRGTAADDKTYVFKGAPEGLQGLVDAGIDVVSLANNHTLDQGVKGMLDTITHLNEYGIKHTGAGNDDTEAYTPVIQEVNGIKVAYLSVSHVLPNTSWKANKYTAGLAEAYDLTRILQAIEETEKLADITIVMVHWGEERESKPEADQLNIARHLIDGGADLIIGSHPHVLQGFEQYNGKWIAYSLGNFVFASHPKGKQAESGVLSATCNKSAECEMTFYPMKIVNAQPTPVEDEEAEEMLQFLQDVSRNGVEIDKRGKLSLAKP
ncbi:CapA family protein [Paenibacillus endoradicis]|uniref:CapA family protein n=1 Tax=Paenibacillus endoradicis TaxID=2972487 RepID=UPI002158C9C7|nr:CapA family protein [Paenibacillus endoradicis]MCR8659113.1 CapA family protein [Paenibacillus endoradicis]